MAIPPGVEQFNGRALANAPVPKDSGSAPGPDRGRLRAESAQKAPSDGRFGGNVLQNEGTEALGTGNTSSLEGSNNRSTPGGSKAQYPTSQYGGNVTSYPDGDELPSARKR